MYIIQSRVLVSVVFGLMVLLGIGTLSAQAIDINDIPTSFADAVGISQTAAELVISAMILLSIGIALSMFKGSNMALTVIIMIAMVGMLTAIGWLDAWLLVMIVLVIALMFGQKLRDWGTTRMSGGS